MAVTKDKISRPHLINHLNEQIHYCDTVIKQYEATFHTSTDIFEVKVADTMANSYRMQKKGLMDAMELVNYAPKIR